ncbi:hypothetical protein [Nocardiopsis composta]|uniref:Uncharacterized protein n=1 Tax=Nocardiopsis composta TaxID=157465 RepID=A0A7W8VEK1_9ACTN|nr:hypothetical protein [Nocardiopsis composta]MBB5433571.1 hypothetical protein [Nocardiopsis composta]
MARKPPTLASQSGRPTVRRRTRSTVVRRAPGLSRRAGDGLPAPRPAEEDTAPKRPTLTWVLATGPDGRTRPEARWA